MKNFFVAIGLFLLVQNAWAINIHDAKSQGLVGEGRSGYLVAVRQPASAEVRALIANVNGKRKARFSATARKTNTTVAQVANRFYELAVQKTARGHYYQGRGGRWKRK